MISWSLIATVAVPLVRRLVGDAEASITGEGKGETRKAVVSAAARAFLGQIMPDDVAVSDDLISDLIEDAVQAMKRRREGEAEATLAATSTDDVPIRLRIAALVASGSPVALVDVDHAASRCLEFADALIRQSAK
jgi:hypothetical protein